MGYHARGRALRYVMLNHVKMKIQCIDRIIMCNVLHTATTTTPALDLLLAWPTVTVLPHHLTTLLYYA